MIDQLDFKEIREHYDRRKETHRLLRNEFDVANINSYVRLALGIEDARGNYSASEHGLGPLILAEPNSNSVFRLAQELERCTKKSHIPEIIYRWRIPYLKISVGSEMGMMLRPNDFWVGNARTIWAHLLLKHEWRLSIANEELELYRDSDRTSEMDYQVWRYLYLAAERNLSIIAEMGNEEAANQGVEPGEFKFLWADTIASGLYNMREL